MKVLWLDDNLTRTSHFRSQVPYATCVETAEECIAELRDNGPWDVVFLDHDLGGEENVASDDENTGAAVCRWIYCNHPDVAFIVIHTLNPVGADEMARILWSGNGSLHLSFLRIPFAWKRAAEIVKNRSIAQ